MSNIVARLVAVVSVVLVVVGSAHRADAAPEPAAEPSVLITVEWMGTSGDVRARVPWMFDLTVKLTSSAGQDFGGQCRHAVWADQPSSFVGVNFDCFDIPDGSYEVELVGVPDDEVLFGPCRSVEVPQVAAGTALGCLTSFISPGIIVDYPPTSVPVLDYPPTSAPDPRPERGNTVDEPTSADQPVDLDELPVTGGSTVGLVVLGVLTMGAGLLLSTVGRRRQLGG